MTNIADPVTQWAFMSLISVLIGTGLLIAVTFVRRWQQTRHARYVHTMRRQYRPGLTKLLSGARTPAGLAALRELPLADLEILLEPLFSKRKITERRSAFFQSLCADLGLIKLWESRLANGHYGTVPASSAHGVPPFPAPATHQAVGDSAMLRHLLRAKSIRNLGTLRYRPSWPLLVNALDDRHPDIQLVALRSLAALRAPESFPALLQRLHAVIQGQRPFPPAQSIQSALVCFDLTCVPALVPSLRHAHHQIRSIAADVLRAIVCDEAARAPGLAFTAEMLSSQIVELLLTELCVDSSAEVRGRAAEAIAYLADPRVPGTVQQLLWDPQWFVRLRTVRALAHLRQPTAPLLPDIGDCLRDSHWRVREAAAQTLIALGQGGKIRLYEHFLISQDAITRQQIVEMMERTGLMSALVEEYSDGAHGLAALMAEQLAGNAAPLGFPGVLQTMDSAVTQKFLDRFLPSAQFWRQLAEEAQVEVASVSSLQQAFEFPLAA